MRAQVSVRQVDMKRILNRNFSHYPVVIVGGGPAGLVASALLSKYKVKHALIERRAEPTMHPQAHFINLRSMEIFQGNLNEVFVNILKASMPSRYWRYVSMRRSDTSTLFYFYIFEK